MLTRRSFVAQLGAAVVVAQGAGLLNLASPAYAQTSVADTYNALLAFVVPGTDAFSVAQGLTHPTPGGVDAGVLPAFIETLDATPSPQPPYPTSAVIAGLLDQVASQVAQQPTRFADLVYPQKVAVFAGLEADPAGAPLAQLLAAGAGFAVYSEAGSLGPGGALTSEPQGWTLTGYPGVADGRDELVGYYRNRRRATS